MRNKEETKKKILTAAKLILARDGFECLKVNTLAEEAGVGKPLIYRYFTDMAGVVSVLASEAYVDEQKFTSVSHAGSEEVLRDLLLGGRGLASDRLTRDLLLWALASDNAPDITNDGVDIEQSLQDIDSVNAADDKLAVYAILKAAIAFVVLYRDRHDNWAGLPIKTPNNMARLEMALAKIIDKVW